MLDLRVAPPVTVQAQTVQKLREAIISGHFAPGQRLVESELARAMGVSRSSVREAIRRLEGEKLIALVANRGPSVALIAWREAAQIHRIRALLEGEAAVLAAEAPATEADLAAMAAALAAFDQAVTAQDAIARLSTTADFYEALFHAGGNAVIAEVLRGLLARITFLRARSMSLPGRAPKSGAEMREILAAITARDGLAARDAAMRHVAAAAEAAQLAM